MSYEERVSAIGRLSPPHINRRQLDAPHLAAIRRAVEDEQDGVGAGRRVRWPRQVIAFMFGGATNIH